MTLPLGYIALKLGYGPVSPFVIAAALQLVASLVSVFIVQYELKKKMGFFFVLLARIYAASILAVIAPYAVMMAMPSSLLRLVVVTIVSIISTTILMYVICLNGEDRIMARTAIKKMVGKLAHRTDNK